LRGDELDLRADIYSVGATLFTLLTARAPFEGENAVQVVANVVEQPAPSVSSVRDDIPAGLERVVARCLAKQREGRFADYASLRRALLPFSSTEPEPASMAVRASAGWIDFLIALLPPYIVLMLTVGAEQLLVQPLAQRTLYSARYHLLLFALGIIYFTVCEGFWGAGLGKWLRGLKVVQPGGRRPGLARAFLRIFIPLASIEAVRIPLMLALIHDAEWTAMQTTIFVLAAFVCGWIPVLLTLKARRENGYATAWDLASGTRVVVAPKSRLRPSVEPMSVPPASGSADRWLGPFKITGEVTPGQWLVATDPVLRRPVWLLRRDSSELSDARRDLSRMGRPRWLQHVPTDDATWDAYEAPQGVPFTKLVEDGQRLPWKSLRHWLHDLASELWSATSDGTMPSALSLDHVWITDQGRAVLIDRPWPQVKSPAERLAVADMAGQQRFLATVASAVEWTGVPLHARPVLQNLADRKFEKLSFLAGTLRGLLDKSAEVGRAVRAGSIFVLPVYVWIAVFLGYSHDKPWDASLVSTAVIIALVVLTGIAVVQLLELPLRCTAGQHVFRLAVVNDRGQLATAAHLLARWGSVWLPLLIPIAFVWLLGAQTPAVATTVAAALLLAWIAAALYAVAHPHRGLHDRLARTWIVRR
jgi:hypothetical protein